MGSRYRKRHHGYRRKEGNAEDNIEDTGNYQKNIIVTVNDTENSEGEGGGENVKEGMK